MKKFISAVFIFTGISVLGSIALPVVLSQLNFSFFQTSALVDPTQTSSGPELAPQVKAASDIDYTVAANWFETSSTVPAPPTVNKISYYTLSVPKVGIQGATIEINGTDLKKNAIQYPGTALPGTAGNTVIFGHSTLASLYKSGIPISIFNPLLKAKIGDEITIFFDGVTYRYQIRELFEVKPTQLEVLAQRYDKYELTLITCTPLGTYLRRFVVKAELVN